MIRRAGMITITMTSIFRGPPILFKRPEPPKDAVKRMIRVTGTEAFGFNHVEITTLGDGHYVRLTIPLKNAPVVMDLHRQDLQDFLDAT